MNSTNVALQRIICISERDYMLRQIVVGRIYYFDKLSVSLDVNGHAYGMIYTNEKERIIKMCLEHFTSADELPMSFPQDENTKVYYIK